MRNFVANALSKAESHPARFFGLLACLVFSPILLGYCFLPASYLSMTPLWYDPHVVPGNFDLFDAIIFFLPTDYFLRDQLYQGVFPFWNPHNFAGYPVAYNGSSGMFYPPKLALLFLFPPWLAHGLSLLLHAWLAGYASFRLGLRLGLQAQSCLFFGILWTFNGLVTVWLEVNNVLICAALTPVLLLTALAARESGKQILPFAATLALLLVCGHLQISLNFILFGLVVGLYLAGPWNLVRSARFLSGIVAGAALAAPMLLPGAVLMSGSQRPLMTADFLLSSYRQFLVSCPPALVFPDLYGNPANFFCWTRISGAGNFIYAETCLYIGVVPLVFGLAAAACRPGRYFLLWAVLIALVPATPLYPVIAKLPGLNHIISVRLVGLLHLFLTLAAAVGYDHWRRSDSCRSARWSYLAVLGLASWAGVTFARVFTQGWQASLAPGLLRVPEPGWFVDRPTFLRAVKAGFESCYSLTNPAFFMPLLSLVLFGVVLLNRRTQRFGPLLLGMALLDLVSFSYHHNPIEPHQRCFPDNSVTSYLQREAGLERVAGLSTIKPNTLLPFAVRDVGGYDSFYPKDSAIFLAALLNKPIEENDLPTQVLPGESLSPTLLDLLGVRFLVGRPGGLVPNLPVVHSQTLPIYRRTTTLPRAFLCGRTRVVPQPEERMAVLQAPGFARDQIAVVEKAESDFRELDPQASGNVTITAAGANFINLQCQTSGTQLLVLTEGWNPGWEVSVDGRPRRLYKVDQMFRGVLVGRGDSQVAFRFRPPLWNLSLILWTVALIGTSLPWLRRPGGK